MPARRVARCRAAARPSSSSMAGDERVFAEDEVRARRARARPPRSGASAAAVTSPSCGSVGIEAAASADAHLRERADPRLDRGDDVGVGRVGARESRSEPTFAMVDERRMQPHQHGAERLAPRRGLGRELVASSSNALRRSSVGVPRGGAMEAGTVESFGSFRLLDRLRRVGVAQEPRVARRAHGAGPGPSTLRRASRTRRST